MRTISRKRPQDSPPGDHTAECDYCGVVWLRSRLRRDRSGLLRCPDEGDGLSQQALSEGNAAAAQRVRPIQTRADGSARPVDPFGPSTYRNSWDETAPEVVTLTPPDGATGVLPTQLVLEFDEVVARGTGTFDVYQGVTLVASVDVQDESLVSFALGVVTISLSLVLSDFTVYYVLVDSGVVLNQNQIAWPGFALATDWNWTTGEAGDDPTLVSSVPSDGATGVLPTAALQLVFSEDVQAGSGTIFLKRYSDDATIDSWNIASEVAFAGDTADLVLTAPLAELTQYYLEIASGVIEDLVGNPYAGLAKGQLEFTTADVTGPTLSSSAPTDGAASVVPNSEIELTFTENVQAASGSILLKRFSDDVTVDSWNVATEVTFVGDTASMTPSGMVGQVQYYLEIASGVIEDLSGNAYAGLTKGALDFTTADVDAPTLVSSTPSDNATGVNTSVAIELVFNEDVQAGSGTIFLKRFSDDVTIDSWNVATEVVFTGSTVDMALAAPLAEETQYYLEIASGVIEDLSGNAYAGLTKGQLDFTTGDETGPTLLSSVPTDNATGVGVSVGIELTFSEDVQAGSGTIFLKRYSDDATIDSWDIDLDATVVDDTVSVTLASPLEEETQYYLEIASGVIEDLSGNAYAGLTKGALDFTTGLVEIVALGTNAGDQFTVSTSSPVDRTVEHTLEAGSNRVMRIIVVAKGGSDTPVFNSVTYGGVTAVLADTRSTALTRSAVYYVLESNLPADGARDIVANVEFPSGSGTLAVFGSAIQNAEQSVDIANGSALGSGTRTSQSVDVTGITDGAWAIGGYAGTQDAGDLTWPAQVEYFDYSATVNRRSGGELQGADGETSIGVEYPEEYGQGSLSYVAFMKAGTLLGFNNPTRLLDPRDAPVGSFSTWPSKKGLAGIGDTDPVGEALGWSGLLQSVDTAGSTTQAVELPGLAAAHTSDPSRSIMVVMAVIPRSFNAALFGLSGSTVTPLKYFVLRVGGEIGFVLRDDGGTLRANSTGAGGGLAVDTPYIVGLAYDKATGRALAKSYTTAAGLVTRHDQTFSLPGATTFTKARLAKVRTDTRLSADIGIVAEYDGQFDEAKLNAEIAHAATIYPV